MILSLIEYGDVIYSGTSCENLNKLDRLFYRGLRICTGVDNRYNEQELRRECCVASLYDRRYAHILLLMYKQKNVDSLLKKSIVNTRQNLAPVFWNYIPKNEKARQNVIYRGAIEWNKIPANIRNLEFNEFKTVQRRNLSIL